jgi:two-component system sensor histidine kinase UhpB
MNRLLVRLIPPLPASLRQWVQSRQFSTFEKVIVANSMIIVIDTAAGWWITQHNAETYHYLIDTGFIALATLLSLVVNFALLRAAFAPLHAVLAVIRAVEHGNLEARAVARESDADAQALARTFNAMLDRLEAERHSMAGRVLQAQEAERRRLALELHDQTGQSLTALTLHAEAIAQRLAGESGAAAAQARHQAEHLAALAQRTLAEVQSLSRQLRPAVLDDLGLPASLRWLVEDAGERLGVKVQVRVRGVAGREVSDAKNGALLVAGQQLRDAYAVEPGSMENAHGRLPDDVETALFRIAQESLTNAVRHGRAHQIAIALCQMTEQVTLTVADNGSGFDPSARGASWRSPTQRAGVGLAGMTERACALGGALRLRTRPGHGCVVRAVIPLPARPAHLQYAGAARQDALEPLVWPGIRSDGVRT